MKDLFKRTAFKNRFYLLLCIFIISQYFIASCSKNSTTNQDSNLLHHKWTLNSRTAVFPGNSTLNFTETSSANDYLDFRVNDSVYSYITLYLPFSIDTASYTVNSNIITVHDTRQYGIIFQHQNSSGEMQTTTDIELISLTENVLVLKFPTQGSVNTNGVTTYYPGTITYRLSR